VLDLIQLENGKARRHAFEEVIDVALTSRYYAHTAEDYLRPKRRQGVQLMLTEVWEHFHPKGLVGVISPWNYPLTLGISDALPALVAGNAVLAKPDDRTPFSHLWAVRMLERAGMPQGLVQTVTGPGSELGTPIIEQSDFLMFTGSTSTGRTVAKQAAERLIDYSMELGGKNALLVLDDADVGKAAKGAVRRLLELRAAVHLDRAHLCADGDVGRVRRPLRRRDEVHETDCWTGLFGRYGLADQRDATGDRHPARRRRGRQGGDGARRRPRQARHRAVLLRADDSVRCA